MSDQLPGDNSDVTKPTPARVEDYVLGGTDNYVTDRRTAEHVFSRFSNAREPARANRRFMGRAVEYLYTRGLRQFLALGTGFPTARYTDQIAGAGDDIQVVYVDHDPAVLAHANALLGKQERATYVHADLRNVDAVISAPETQRLLDLTQPVGLLLVSVMHYLADEDDPAGLIRRYAQRLAAGSFVVMSSASSTGIDPEMLTQIRETSQLNHFPLYLRPQAEIAGMFGDLDLVEPGLVSVSDWPDPSGDPPLVVPIFGGAARSRWPGGECSEPGDGQSWSSELPPLPDPFSSAETARPRSRRVAEVSAIRELRPRPVTRHGCRFGRYESVQGMKFPQPDVRNPSPARVYDYLLGGTENYAVDRELVEKFSTEWPGLAAMARSNRAWAIRVVRHLAGDEEIGQFLDLGSGLPTEENVHQVGQRISPQAKVVYVDNDPSVLAHGHALLEDNLHTHYVHADVREPDVIIDAAAAHLDLNRPVAVLLASVLHYVPGAPGKPVHGLMRRMPPGSYLAVAHLTSDGAPAELLERTKNVFKGGLIPRPSEQIAGLFDGLEMVDPGLVDVQRWRTDAEEEIAEWRLLGGLARKP